MAWRIELPVNEIVARYKEGESTRGLGQAYGVSRGTVERRLLAAGVTIRPRGGQLGQHKRGGPLSLCVHNDGYLRTTDRAGRRCSIHRGCYEACCGEIPDGHVVHHIDKDQLNNAIENLACMTQGEHMTLHSTLRGWG